MSVEYQQASSIAVVKGVATNSQLANVVKFYTGSVTYDDEPSSKYASVTINGKTQRVMLCIAVSGTVAYDDSPCLYSTVSGHRCLNITEPTATETPDDIPNAITTLTISGKNYPAIRCILINKTPTYDGVSSTCTFTDDNGKIHTAQLVNQVGSGSIEKIVKGVPPLTLDNAIADSLQYVKAFGGTAQRNLPAGYTQRNFIYMMDGSYLLTDLVPTYDCKIEMDFETTSLPAGNGVFFGTRTNTSDGSGVNLAFTAAKSIVIDTFGHRKTSSNVFTANTRYKYTYANSTSTLTSGGTTVETDASGGTDVITVPLIINAMNNNGTVYGNLAGIYLYSFKMWDNQGNLIADYVPCAQLHPLTVGFYDMVTGTFMTATAGTFAAGTEAVPTPDAPMDIVCNNGVLKARHQSGLPLGYTLLDSVVFDSTQEIDTGFTPNNNTRIESKCYRTGADCWFYGASPSNPRVTLYHSSTGTCRWGNQSRSNVGFVADTEYTIVEDKNGLNINGVNTPWASGTAGDFTCDRSLTIGNNNGSTGTRYFAGNFYYMKIYDNGVLARDFVPCQNASNVVGLYDRVNGVFYTDTGLVAGSTVSDPVEIYTDGTVETIGIFGENIFNSTGAVQGYLTQTGSVLANSASSRKVTDFIAVKPNTTYVVYGGTFDNAGYGRLAVQYDNTQTKITDVAYSADGTTFTTAANCESVRIQYMIATETRAYIKEVSSTATCEDLLSIGNYTDEQEIISGGVTRKVGVKVLDGTENWISGGGGTGVWANFQSITGVAFDTTNAFCSHSVYGGANVNIVNMNQNEFCLYDNRNISFKNANTTSTSDWETFLAQQYANGTPVIVVYPLATSTTDTVTGQPMNTVQGDNTLEITQASLEDLEVEVKYEQ